MRTLFLLAAVLSALSVTADERPNVLFLICDDLNCDLGCYGNGVVASPNIDGLAARGVRFGNTYCQYPLCGPSRASMMTGRYPDQTGIHQNAVHIRQTMPDVLTMPQAFRAAGYDAVRIGKIYHYDVPRHIGTGGHDDPYSWDRTINPEGHDTAIEDKIFTLTPGRFGGTLSWYADDAPAEEQTDGIAATETDRVLEQYARSGDPLFLAVGLYRPHTPFVTPEDYFNRYSPDDVVLPQVPENYFETLPGPAVKTLTKKRHQRNLAPELGRAATAAYHAAITFADAQIGRILESLQRHGMADNTIVVFTSDHGYHLGPHDWYQKQTLFEDATRVPLIFAGPGIAPERTAAGMAELVDLYPTLGTLAGIDVPADLPGRDLSAMLRGDVAEPVRQDAFSQLLSGYSLRTPDYRLTLWGKGGVDGVELYDLASDPAEMNNLGQSEPHQSVRTRLTTRLKERIAASGR